jgi:DNA-binding NarL/FixJ family response regulator
VPRKALRKRLLGGELQRGRNPLRVLVIDDHEIVRSGIVRTLESDRAHRFTVVGAMADFSSANAVLSASRPDVIVVDVKLPDLPGPEAVAAMRRALRDVRVIAFSAYDDPQTILLMLVAGADGFVSKADSVQELLSAIVAVNQPDAKTPYLGKSAIASLDCGRGERSKTETGSPPPLSKRESEVLELIAFGMTNKEIAGKLAIAVRTVATHREHIMHKLDIHTIAGLTQYYLHREVTRRGGE